MRTGVKKRHHAKSLCRWRKRGGSKKKTNDLGFVCLSSVLHQVGLVCVRESGSMYYPAGLIGKFQKGGRQRQDGWDIVIKKQD